MGWWFGRKSAPADARPFVPAWLQTDAAEEGFARFLTFELIADAGPPPLSLILGDASDGAISCDATETVSGYAAYGRSIAAAVQPLINCFDVSLFDDGAKLRAPLDRSPVAIDAEELGNSAAGENVAKVQREQLPVRAVPSALRLTYYDPARDYQTGEARAIAGEQGENEVQQELPAVMSSGEAKSLVQRILARQWTGRDRLTLRLPPSRISVEPGSILLPGVVPGAWIVDKRTLDGFVTIAELHPAWQPAPSLAGEAGRIVSNEDIVEAPTIVALIDAPMLGDAASTEPRILIAASSASPGWSRRAITVSGSGQTFATASAARKSLIGGALTVLGDAQPYIIDEVNSVEVELVDHEQWLTSCDDDAFAEGANLAVLGSEIVQFGDVEPLGNGRFRLRRLLRGRAGTEWASTSHLVGELFCLLEGNSLRALTVPPWLRGSILTAADRSGTLSSLTFLAECMTPLSPWNLRAAISDEGELILNWTRRSRVGLVWIDEVDSPLGESREQYRVSISRSGGSLEVIADQPGIAIPLTELASLGGGAASIEIRQLGDWAASHPAQLTITIPQE